MLNAATPGSKALNNLLEQAQADLTEAREELEDFKQKHRVEMNAADQREAWLADHLRAVELELEFAIKMLTNSCSPSK